MNDRYERCGNPKFVTVIMQETGLVATARILDKRRVSPSHLVCAPTQSASSRSHWGRHFGSPLLLNFGSQRVKKAQAVRRATHTAHSVDRQQLLSAYKTW